jgi:tetratricopeptide (TPR) repeat protein
MSNLAILYYSQDRYAKAEPLCLATVELRRRVLGKEHPSTLASLNSLATLYRIQGRYPEAEALFVNAVAVRRRVLGEGHPDTLLSMNGLAILYQAQGQLAKGERIGREVLESARKRSGGPSLPVADALTTLGENLLAQQKYAEAEPLLRECLAIREPKQPNEWWTYLTKSLLGGSLLGQKKYSDAEPLLVAGYEGLHTCEARIPGPARHRLAEALARLVQLYEATARHEQAAVRRKQLEGRKEADKKAGKPEQK